jgi:hypothetical protein
MMPMPESDKGPVPLEVLSAVERESDEISMRYIDELMAQADDPYAQLALIRVALEAVDRHAERLKALRLGIVVQQRDAGDPMTEIAAAAGVGDSYLSRLVIRAGGARRSDRTRRRRRRRAG